MTDDYEPLYELNKGVCEFLQDKIDAGKKSLLGALERFQTPKGKFDPSAVRCVLLLEPTQRKVWYCDSLPIDAAILFNLWHMGNFTREELEAELTKLYPAKVGAWLSSFAPPE